eukprot:1934428-Pyramimonas_sp.AAC.1
MSGELNFTLCSGVNGLIKGLMAVSSPKYAGAMRAPCRCHSCAMRAPCGCHAGAVQVSCRRHAGVLRMPCGRHAGAVRCEPHSITCLATLHLVADGVAPVATFVARVAFPQTACESSDFRRPRAS